MSQVDRDQIERALPQKGFVREDTHHRYFWHEYGGRRTGAYTYTSHGSHYKTYSDPLLKKMKQQLRLDSIHDVKDLLQCPMNGELYNQKLRAKGLIN